MNRTLIAFGDSHTAGSEIDEKNSVSCHLRAYPSHIAKYYGFGYKNFSQTGGSNEWSLLKFNKVIKTVIENKEKVFVLFNFLEPSRTFFYDKNLKTSSIMHCVPKMLEKSYIKQLSKSLKYKSKEEQIFLRNYILDYKKIAPLYEKYLKKYTDDELIFKSKLKILYVQKICQENNIPFIFHTSCSWYSGNWYNILKSNFYGHDQNFYEKNITTFKSKKDSFWGLATTHPNWKHIQKNDRWSEHYPEEYHKYYASLLINFINKQKLLA